MGQVLVYHSDHGEMNIGVESLKRCLFSPSWEQVQRKGSCRLLLDQLKFCWNSTPHARNAKTVYGERQEHEDTRIMVPRSIGQYRKQRMHGARSSSRRMLQPSTKKPCGMCRLLPEHHRPCV